MKIAVIGYAGSGKSTVAKFLSEYYEIPLLYLDKVGYKANWRERDREESCNIVREFLAANDNWVIDGNFHRILQEERLELSDKIIFLNFSRFACIFRAIKRSYMHRRCPRESISDGCSEKLGFDFIRWILWDGRTKKYRGRFKEITEKYGEKTVVIKNQRQLDKFYKEYKK